MTSTSTPRDPVIPTTKILRNNAGMIRDCWFEKDIQDENGAPVFCIRQINLVDGAEPKCKIIRLLYSEYVAIAAQLKSFFEHDDRWGGKS